MAMNRRAVDRILAAELISSAQMPSLAGRVCETWMKQQLLRWEDRTVKQELALYRAAFRFIEDAARGAAGARKKPDRSWANAMTPVIRMRVMQLGQEVSRLAGAAATAAYAAGFYGRAWLLDMMTRPEVQVDVTLPDVRVAIGSRVLQESGPDVWAMIADEFGAGWWRIFNLEYEQLLLNLQRVLNQGVREGLGMADIMDKVADKFGLDMTPGGGYRSNFNVVQAVTRTYIMNASNQGAADVYRQNAALLGGMRHLTARDERTCLSCQRLEGHLYPLDEWNLPPIHPNCRCTVIPVLREDYADVYLNEPPREYFAEWTDRRGLGLFVGAFLGGVM